METTTYITTGEAKRKIGQWDRRKAWKHTAMKEERSAHKAVGLAEGSKPSWEAGCWKRALLGLTTAKGIGRKSSTTTSKDNTSVADTPYQCCTSGGSNLASTHIRPLCEKCRPAVLSCSFSICFPLFLFCSVPASVNIDSARVRLDCKCWGPVGPAPMISTLTGDKSMALASAIALFLATVDRKSAIAAWSLMEGEVHRGSYREPTSRGLASSQGPGYRRSGLIILAVNVISDHLLDTQLSSLVPLLVPLFVALSS